MGSQEPPKRPLTLLDVTCIGINAIVGSSIFLFPGRLAGFLGPASIVAFGLTGLLLVSVGLCFAEAAGRFNCAGGPYVYARAAFGRHAGFAIGWMCWVTIIVSWAAVANGIALYLGHFGPAFSGPVVVKGVAAAVIVALGFVNHRGVKLGAWASNFFTAAKLIPLLLFVAVGLPFVDWSVFTPLAPHGWEPMGKACFLAYFAFQGFETVPVPAGEVENPERNVPLAVVGSLVFSAFLYMLVQAVAVGVHPGLAGAERPLAEAAGKTMGAWGAALIVLGAVFSTIGFNAGCALGGPRYLVALAEKGDFPSWWGAIHPRHGTPHRAIAATTLLALGAALLLDFNRLVDFSNIVVCAQYLSTCAAVPFLRKREPRPGAMRLPGGWAIPAAGIAATLWLGAQGGISELGWSLALLVLGFVLRAGLGKTAATAGLIVVLFGAPLGAETLGEAVMSRVSNENIVRLVGEASSEPHVAGTEASERQAAWLEKLLLEYGLEVQKRRYEVLLDYPVEASLKLMTPQPVELVHLEGDLLPVELRKKLKREDLIPWNAYSASGEVKAQAVYANFCRPEDFKELEKLGVSAKGRIVLCRYGMGYRGGKTMEAEARGASGILFYSDPAQDGYFQGDALPKGPWGPPDHFQRGSNVYDFIVPGDPLTPGWPSIEGAKRISAADSVVLPKIPSLPLSYESAGKILSVLEGPVVPKGWQGALPLTYHVGPGSISLRLKVKNDRRVRPIVNVLGRVRGSEEPEKLVILSFHHDAWTRGAVDDGVGTAAVLELARVFSQLAKEGRRPRRTILFAGWDAEEYTLTGSTEWGEEKASELRENGVALLNIDAYRWGADFTAIAVPSLKPLIAEAAAAAGIAEAWKAGPEKGEVGIMGSGSDYTVFLNHLGIPAVETMFTGTAGVYHSIYDEAAWLERVDPGLKRVAAIARMNGFMAARLADAPLLPFDYAAYARDVRGYLNEAAAAHPGADLAGPLEAAAAWEKAGDSFAAASKPGDFGRLRCANAELMKAERGLLDEAGLPGRPWFKHLLYAPKPTYEALCLPGLREALARGDSASAARQADALRAALQRAALSTAKAAACLE